MRGRKTTRGFWTWDSFYLYEEPRDHQKPPEVGFVHQKPPEEEFVLPI